MEVGCGARARHFEGRRYWHFRHDERSNGRSVRREEYVGRVDSPRAREDLLRRIAEYDRRAEMEFARRRAKVERLVALAAHAPPWGHGPRGHTGSAARIPPL